MTTFSGFRRFSFTAATLGFAFSGFLICGATMAAEKKGPPVPGDMKPAELISPQFVNELREVVKHEIVQITVRAQNARHQDIQQAEIEALDKQWVSERKAEDKPLISATLSNPLSVYLLRMQARSSGLYSEIFIMDNKGLNVGQSSITSDYWQGDEAKYKKTFLVGKDAVFIDDPEWNDDTRTWRAQVNMTIADTTGDGPIGAAVFEINLTELKRRLGS
ncbi:MAG: hypothetical protein AB7G34_12940 [Hyphomicrobiales bacterium]